ncbi:MAG: DNA replication/repair protein RecF [Luteibaculaceae bacterium]
MTRENTFLSDLTVLQFKNWEEASLNFSERLICFLGNNGSGKTNLLDAIHYLSIGKSAFNAVDSQNIRFEESFFMVQGKFIQQSEEYTVTCSLKKGSKKQLKLNKTDYEKIADHVGRFPVVVISPYDDVLITEGSEERRKFMDSIIAQFNAGYLNALIQYNKVLSQRNALLKQMQEQRSSSPDLLEVYNEQLLCFEPEIAAARLAFLVEFAPKVQHYYQHIAQNMEQVNVELDTVNPDNLPFKQLLEVNFRRDISRGFTTVGPHKDDLSLLLNGLPIKKFGSQGQRKSMLLALKLAQYEILAEKKQRNPILLLDDVFDKMDEGRLTRLLELLVQKNFGQVFFTDAHPNRLPNILKKHEADCQLFSVNAGKITT